MHKKHILVTLYKKTAFIINYYFINYYLGSHLLTFIIEYICYLLLIIEYSLQIFHCVCLVCANNLSGLIYK